MICLDPRFNYSPYHQRWRPVKQGIDSLSKREREISELTAHGWCLKEIAKKLGITPTTTQTHRQRAMTKLRVENTIELTHFLLARGVIKNLYADEPNG